MALVDDVTIVALLASSAFFVALSFGLLIRYRKVSQRINASTDLGHDLWQALEQRMKKQDERILDMMGRMEVVQARVIASPVVQVPMAPTSTQRTTPSAAPRRQNPSDVEELGPVAPLRESQPRSQESQTSQPPIARPELDEMQLAAMKLLSQSAKNTRQLADTLKKSREHTARTMKELFEMGLVRRNDSTKPFVYQLTEVGRRYVSSS